MKKFVKEQPTPFYLYDEKRIKASVQRLQEAFDRCARPTLYVPVRMNPNAAILRILLQSGCGVSCASRMELMLCARVGFSGERILYAPMTADSEADELCRSLGVIRVIDSEGTIPVCLPQRVLLRLRATCTQSRSASFGSQKFGLSEQRLLEVAAHLHQYSDCTIGLCADGAAMENDPLYYQKTAQRLFALAARAKNDLGLCFDAVHLGGGLPFDYRHTDDGFAPCGIAEALRDAKDSILSPAGLEGIRLSLEPGRYLLAGSAVFVTRVCAVKEGELPMLVTDGSMAHFGRLAQFGNYHLISVLGKHDVQGRTLYSISGSLSDSRDHFARSRLLPPVKPGDCIIIHDVGADGAAMQNGYGGALRCAQYLHAANGVLRLIAPPQSPEQWLHECGLELLQASNKSGRGF